MLSLVLSVPQHQVSSLSECFLPLLCYLAPLFSFQNLLGCLSSGKLLYPPAFPLIPLLFCTHLPLALVSPFLLEAHS